MTAVWRLYFRHTPSFLFSIFTWIYNLLCNVLFFLAADLLASGHFWDCASHCYRSTCCLVRKVWIWLDGEFTSTRQSCDQVCFVKHCSWLDRATHWNCINSKIYDLHCHIKFLFFGWGLVLYFVIGRFGFEVFLCLSYN